MSVQSKLFYSVDLNSLRHFHKNHYTVLYGPGSSESIKSFRIIFMCKKILCLI